MLQSIAKRDPWNISLESMRQDFCLEVSAADFFVEGLGATCNDEGCPPGDFARWLVRLVSRGSLRQSCRSSRTRRRQTTSAGSTRPTPTSRSTLRPRAAWASAASLPKQEQGLGSPCGAQGNSDVHRNPGGHGISLFVSSIVGLMRAGRLGGASAANLPRQE